MAIHTSESIRNARLSAFSLPANLSQVPPPQPITQQVPNPPPIRPALTPRSNIHQLPSSSAGFNLGTGQRINTPLPQNNIQQIPPRQYLQRSTLQRIFLVVTAVLTILSAILPTRPLSNALNILVFSLAQQPIAENLKLSEKILLAARVACLIVALIGSILSMPVLLIATLAADLAYQIFAVAESIYHGEYKKAAFHAILLTVDALALGAIVAGSWQLMTAALAITAATMLVQAFTNLPEQ